MSLYNISEFSQLIHVSMNTLRRWDKEKILVAGRTATNRRFYTQEQYRNYLLSLEQRTKKIKEEEKKQKKKGGSQTPALYFLRINNKGCYRRLLV